MLFERILTACCHGWSYSAMALSLRSSFLLFFTRARSKGSKNASSIAYVHVPRSLIPKRVAGLSKSFRGRCCSMSVNTRMVIWHGNMCGKKRKTDIEIVMGIWPFRPQVQLAGPNRHCNSFVYFASCCICSSKTFVAKRKCMHGVCHQLQCCIDIVLVEGGGRFRKQAGVEVQRKRRVLRRAHINNYPETHC